MKFFMSEIFFVLLSLLIFFSIFDILKLLLTILIGRIFNLNLTDLSILCFYFKKEDEKFKLKIIKPNSISNCTMTNDTLLGIKRAIFCLLPQVICLFLAIIFMFNVNKIKAFSEFSFIAFAVLLTLIVSEIMNFVKMIKAFLGDSPAAQVEKFNKEMLNAINQGVRPLNFNMVDFKPYSTNGLDPSYLTYLYLKFCYYLENQRFIELKPIINAFVNNLPQTFTEIYTPQAYSLLFYYSFIDINPVLANNYYYYVEEQLLKDKDANSFRIYAYYLYFVRGDKENAYDVTVDGLKICEDMPDKGLSLMEHDLLEHLLNIMLNESNINSINLNSGFNKSFT